MKEVSLTEQQLKDLVETYDMQMDEFDCFLNIETGEVVSIAVYDREEEDEELSEAIEEGFNETFFRLPARTSSEGYRDMIDFAETVTNDKLRTKLFNALDHTRKVFRKFKDTLSTDSLELERYYRFVEQRNQERVMEWLESINVKLTIEPSL